MNGAFPSIGARVHRKLCRRAAERHGGAISRAWHILAGEREEEFLLRELPEGARPREASRRASFDVLVHSSIRDRISMLYRCISKKLFRTSLQTQRRHRCASPAHGAAPRDGVMFLAGSSSQPSEALRG